MAERIRVIIEGVDAASQVLAGIKKESDALNTSLKHIGTGLAVAGAAIAGAISLTVKAAADQQQATESLAAAMRNTHTFTEAALTSQLDFASALQRTTVFSDDAITRMQALLVNFGHLGGPALQEATKATVGFAAALNIDLEAAARRVALAIDGSADSLGRFGVQFDANATQQERFQAIMAKGLSLFGTAEAQATTFTGRLLQFKHIVNDLGETIGNVLLPGLTDVLKRLTEAMKAVDHFAKAHPKLTATIVETTVALGLLALALAPILTFWPQLVKFFQFIIPLVVSFAVELGPLIVVLGLLVAAMLTTEGGAQALGMVIDSLVAGFQFAAQAIAAAIVHILDALLFIAEKVPLAFGPLGLALLPFKDQIHAIREEVDQLAKGSLVALGDSVNNVSTALAGGGPAAGLVDQVPVGGGGGGGAGAGGGGGGLPPQLLEGITGQAQEAQIIWSAAFAQMAQDMRVQFDAMHQTVQGFGDGLIAFLESLKQKWGAGFGSMRNFVSNFVQVSAKTIADGLGTAISDIILGTKSASEAFKEFGKLIIRAIVEFVAEYVAQLLVAKAFSLIFSAFIATTAGTIANAWLPAAVLATIATLGAAAIQAPIAIGGALGVTAGAVKVFAGAAGGGLTKMQHGGIVTEPTFALIGEAGPEAVVPLDQAGGFGQTVVNVSVQVDKALLNSAENIDEFATMLARKIGRIIDIRQMMPAGVQR
ncbi:MAG: phage tail tape measure protein [Ramlibacter sp.]|nr:phage tail tape measure protein [Ramlibacter sp.]